MSSSVRPLCIFPYPAPPEQMELVKQAKANLALDYMVIPEPAVPGGDERVLALGELPPFLCVAALVKDPTNAQSVENALRWLLTAPPDDDRGFGYTDYLSAIFGPGVKDLGIEPTEQKVRFE